MKVVRRTVGAGFYLLGLASCLGSLVADPFTAYGFDNEVVRPSVALVSINLAATSITSFALSGLLLFTPLKPFGVSLWVALAAIALVCLASDAYRIIWIMFDVLPGG